MDYLYFFILIIVRSICIECLVSVESTKRLSNNNEKLRKLQAFLGMNSKTKSLNGGFQTHHSGSTQDSKSHRFTGKMLSLQADEVNHDQTYSGRERSKRSTNDFNITDSSWSTQWHLHPDQTPSMGVYEAWEKGYTGRGIVVGLVDEGIDVTHNDLIANYNASLSYDFIDNTAGGSYLYSHESHGTRAAGVIAASKNDDCVIGIAYEAEIASFRTSTVTDGITDAKIAMAFTYSYDSVDIYNNAYGEGDGHGSGFYYSSEVLRAAIVQGITEGRNGKGAIYVFAAGNDGEYFDDCNAVEIVNSIYTISVTSLAPEGGPATYAEECTCVMVATYAGQLYDNGTKIYLSTTNINNTCIENYGGSAASASVASGILALTLQANPDLTWRDMQHLIAETSTSYGVPGGHFYVNGAGKNVSLSLGFGVMNANQLVETATTWQSVPERLVCSSGNLQVDKCCTSSVEASYIVEDCQIRYLEHVQVHILCEAHWREYTEIHLMSPQGTDNRILRQRKQDVEIDEIDWTFMSVHYWGENPAGNWSIRIDDFLNCDNRLTLSNWTLTLYGTVTSPLEGKPNNGTLGGHCDNVTSCTDGTDCLLDSNICVDCTVTGHRIVDSFCVKDGYGYCDADITCKQDNTWCNEDNVCVTCATGYREISGVCKQDGVLGGYCDAIKVCVETGVACKSHTNLCVNCTNGYHIVSDFCIQDGIFGGYCDTDTPCITTYPGVSCDRSTSACVNCNFVNNHRILDGFCVEDGTIGGFCNSDTACVVTGSGCDAETDTCTNCTITGYRSVGGYCKQDGTLDGYCDTNETCTEGAGCDFESNVCVNCTSSGYRVLPDGYCRQDAVIDGYCDSEVPCVTFAAGCIPDYNTCAICYAGHTLVDGYCIEDDVPETQIVGKDSKSNAGAIASIVITGIATGVLLNGIIFIAMLQKTLIAKTGYAPQNLKDRFVYVFNALKGFAK